MSGVRLYLGRCGSGKTYGIQQAIAAGVRSSSWRFLVLDVNDEMACARDAAAWRGPGPRIRIAKCKTLEQCRESFAKGSRVVAYQPTISDDEWAKPNPLGASANALAKLAMDMRPCILVLPEMHNACAEGYPLPGNVAQIVHRWRHLDVHLWGDTQNLAHVKKEVVKACEVLYVYATGSPQDLDALKRIGKGLDGATLTMAGHVDKTDERGWHIRVSTARPLPPWVAVRWDGKTSRTMNVGGVP